jgi:thiamine pyrophosphokinase
MGTRLALSRWLGWSLLLVPGEECMRAVIIAGGQTEGEGWQRWVRADDWIIGADGGAARALAWGLVPDLVIGDMDSLPESARSCLEARGCRFVEHPRAKDQTDLELALQFAVEEGAREIVVMGALGGRIDHTLANVLLLALPSLTGVSIRLAEGEQEALLARSGETIRLEGAPGELVSLLPLGGDAHGISTQGLAWALHGDTLHFGSSRGVSNEMTSTEARVQVGEGRLLVVHAPPPVD